MLVKLISCEKDTFKLEVRQMTWFKKCWWLCLLKGMGSMHKFQAFCSHSFIGFSNSKSILYLEYFPNSFSLDMNWYHYKVCALKTRYVLDSTCCFCFCFSENEPGFKIHMLIKNPLALWKWNDLLRGLGARQFAATRSCNEDCWQWFLAMSVSFSFSAVCTKSVSILLLMIFIF